MRKFTDKINESKEEFRVKELELGIKIESEHGDVYDELKNWSKKTFQGESVEVMLDDKGEPIMPWTEKEFYEKIAKAHLKEIPDYYTRLNKMEKDAE
jgi:hypothetical protein